MRKIALISCTKSKQTYPSKAMEYIVLPIFLRKLCGTLKKHEYDDWFILSAKHGLLKKETFYLPMMLHYCQSARQRKDWLHRIYLQLNSLNDCEIDFYAGSKYREYLIPLLEKNGFICRIPLQELPIGKQLQFYTQAFRYNSSKRQ